MIRARSNGFRRRLLEGGSSTGGRVGSIGKAAASFTSSFGSIGKATVVSKGSYPSRSPSSASSMKPTVAAISGLAAGYGTARFLSQPGVFMTYPAFVAASDAYFRPFIWYNAGAIYILMKEDNDEIKQYVDFDCADFDVIGDENTTSLVPTEFEGIMGDENATAVEFCTDVYQNLVESCTNPEDCGYLLEDTYDGENAAVSIHRGGLKMSMVVSILTMMTLLLSQLLLVR